ncbi:MAG TPA: efflux RND transporter periplasmic adaptor subunit [Pirellulales bacterium]|nr:efflux RND transporter periplasmic adaptor subunit [Pirellulales bacterium]
MMFGVIAWKRLLVAYGALAAIVAALGCHREPKAKVVRTSDDVKVRVTSPQKRNIVRVVGQPSFVESYERTSIYPKLTAYIEKWYVDIGDRVTRGQTLADLFVPEVEEDCKTKKATVDLNRQRVELAKKTVLVAQANVRSAEAQLKSAKSIWAQYDAQVVRWESQVDRLNREVQRGVVDPQILLESQNQARASAAARAAAEADITKAEADLESKKATLYEDEVAVAVAEANVEVATSDWKRLEAWVGYLKLYAPFDGVIVARNANTGDFILPATGDPSADHRAPDLSPNGTAAPVYVVDRTDVVRVFIDIPEHDANFVQVGTKASVLVKAFCDQPVLATVTRTSWALNMKSRTLRAEIDLPNTGSKVPDDLPQATRDALAHFKLPKTGRQILPGMYAYGKVIIERPGVLALPVAALSYSGDATYYWSYENGTAIQTEIQTGASDSQWIEVTNRRKRHRTQTSVHHVSAPVDESATDVAVGFDDDLWVPFTGREQAILGDLSILTDGAAVQLVADTELTTSPSAPEVRSVAADPGQQ